MAKIDQKNFFKQHMEKLIVAAAGLAMIVVIIHWVISSPRTVELASPPGVPLSKTAYSPHEVDDAIMQMANGVAARIQSVTPSTQPVPAYARTFSYLAKQPLDSTDSTMIALGLPPTGDQSPPLDKYWPPIGKGNLPVQPDSPISPTKIELAQLVEALGQVAPKPPEVIIAQEVIAVPAAAAGAAPAAAQFKEVLVAHLCSVYEFAQAQAALQEELKKAYLAGLSFVYMNVEVERQDMLPNGQWGPAVAISQDRVPLPTSMPTVPPLDGKNLAQVYEVVRQLNDPAWQKEILQPSWYSIMYPNRQWGSWLVEGHKPRTLASKLPDAGATPAVSLPTPPVSLPGMTAPGVGNPALPGMPGSREEMEAARRRAMMAAMGINPNASAPPRPGPGMAVPSPIRPAAPTALPVATPAPGGTVAAAPDAVAMPSWQTQLSNGMVEYWAHDTRVQAGGYYRYRVRLALLNPMLGRDRELSSEAEARTISLLTPWSDWSAKIQAPRPTVMFLVGSDGNNGNVRIEVFTKKWGQTVKSSFTVRRGEAIGQDNMVVDVQPLEGGAFQKEKVDFRTGAVAVDFDFEKKQIKGTIPVVTAEMVFLGPDGQLGSRICDDDQNSKARQDMNSQVVESPTVRTVTPVTPRPATRPTPTVSPTFRPPGMPAPGHPF